VRLRTQKVHVFSAPFAQYDGEIYNEAIIMETAQLIQAAASIVGAMAASQYGKFGGMDPAKITDIATIAVKIARAIESAAGTKPLP
jgi:roadblock/LC7 domain-containing protein